MGYLMQLFTRDKPICSGLCFVLMPFHGRFNEMYSSVIKPTVEKQGLSCLRADEIYTDKSIMHDIWDSIQQAEIIIGDITEKNPNVLYELGLAHAMWRKTILITQKMSDVPFDLRQLRIIEYSDQIGAEKKLSQDLQTALIAMLKSQTNDPTIALRQRLEKDHIYCAKNIRESSYNLKFFIARTRQLLIITGTSLFGVLTNSEYRDGLIELIHRGIKVQLILGDRASLRAFRGTAETDLQKSARLILSMRQKIPNELQENLEVFFHFGASTLSATISDPDDDNGILAFTPRWAVDSNPDDRLFCVLEKSKHSDLFSAIFSERIMLTVTDGMTLEQVVKDFDENPPK